ncbi:MAG: DnaK suppressor protein [Nocardioidaceae bacterium]|nr:DnaK suppressor protein [Nocardioidaceae bacterium]
MATKKSTTVKDVSATAAKSRPAKAAPTAKTAAAKPAVSAKPTRAAQPAAATGKKATAKPVPAASKTTQPANGTARAKAPAKRPPTTAAGRSAAKLAVREGEPAWTAAEIAELRETLVADAERLRVEIRAAETEIGQLLREGGEGAGNDQADVGSNTFERDHEMSMAKNARANLELVESAVKRIDAGTYGVCESCGNPVGKMRLQAFPRATLCMECKQRQERR